MFITNPIKAVDTSHGLLSLPFEQVDLYILARLKGALILLADMDLNCEIWYNNLFALSLRKIDVNVH